MVSRAWVAALAVACAVLAASEARAQTTLGGQRVGTSSGDFLKIGMGAKATAMGEAYVAIADDPSALYWNPAGVASHQSAAVLFSHTSWLSDLSIEYAAALMPVARLADGVVGLQVAGLSTDIDETTELAPDGTGRSFTYSDLLIGGTYARHFTDKLAIGTTVKYLREDLGSEVGGGVVNTWLADLGTLYRIGWGDMSFGVTIANFGPELEPGGDYERFNHVGSSVTSQSTGFIGFAPPTTFKMGLSSTLYRSERLQTMGAIEMNRPGDNAETFKVGGEVLLYERLALRAGYDANADEIQFSGGGGVQIPVGREHATVDYAFSDSESFGRVDRFSLWVQF